MWTCAHATKSFPSFVSFFWMLVNFLIYPQWLFKSWMMSIGGQIIIGKRGWAKIWKLTGGLGVMHSFSQRYDLFILGNAVLSCRSQVFEVIQFQVFDGRHHAALAHCQDPLGIFNTSKISYQFSIKVILDTIFVAIPFLEITLVMFQSPFLVCLFEQSWNRYWWLPSALLH